uniref:Uncharacterized protein n=1 Tax=Prevotella sp. GTC17260 TaxID=3236796 RepID=A0AB33J9U2_9BACT
MVDKIKGVYIENPAEHMIRSVRSELLRTSGFMGEDEENLNDDVEDSLPSENFSADKVFRKEDKKGK